MDITEIYSTMNHLNLIDKDDIILYLSSQMDIIDKINRRRKNLKFQYQLYNNHILTINRFLKYVLFRNRISDLIATTRLDSEKYTNTETLLGIPISEIQEKLFFSFTENGFRYAFDIRELEKLIDYDLKNPYNTLSFPYRVVKQVKRLMRTQNFGDILAYIQMSIPLNSNESAKIASVFNTLCNLYVYPDIRKFLKFTGQQYLYFIQDLRTNVLINRYIPCYLYDLILNSYDISVERTRRYVLDVLLKILSVKDNNRYTRALVISEQITNTFLSNVSDASNTDDSNDSDNDDEPSSSIRIQQNPLFRHARLTTTRRRRLLRLNRQRNLFTSTPAAPIIAPPSIPTITVRRVPTRTPPRPPTTPPPTPPPLPPGLLLEAPPIPPLEPVIAINNIETDLFSNIITETENVLNELEEAHNSNSNENNNNENNNNENNSNENNSNENNNNDINSNISELTDSIQTQINNLLSRLEQASNTDFPRREP